MALLILWQDDAGATQSLQFDVVETESHEGLVEVTEHPVEVGANVSDHARVSPERITIEGFISMKPLASNPGVDKLGSFRSIPLDLPPDPSIPLGVGVAIRAGLDALLKSVPTHYTAFAFNAFKNRVLDAVTKIDDVKNKRRRCRIITSIRPYRGMILERLANPRTVENAGGLVFQIDFRQIRVVRSETVDAPQPAEARGAPTQALGSQAAEKAENQEQKRKSLLASGHDALFGGSGGLFGF